VGAYEGGDGGHCCGVWLVVGWLVCGGFFLARMMGSGFMA
jgi:hypothetical protein